MKSLLSRVNIKNLLKIFTVSLTVILIITNNVYALYFDSLEDFSRSIPGDNNTEQWKSSQNIYYNVREKDGNRFMETAKAQHVDYLTNESVNNALMAEFSVSYKVKFIKLETNDSSLSFMFRANDISNAYCVRLRKNTVELLDMDIADPNYAGFPNNRTVLASASYEFTDSNWYGINIVSTLIGSPYKNNDGVQVRNVLNEVYVNGIKVIENEDYATWFIIGNMMFYSWDANTYIDDIFINFDPEKFRPTEAFTIPDDFYKTCDTPLSEVNISLEKDSPKPTISNKVPSPFRTIHIVAIALFILFAVAIIFLILYTRKLKLRYKTR